MRTFNGVGDCIFQESNVVVYGIVDRRCEAIGVAGCGSWRRLRSWLFGRVRSSKINQVKWMREERGIVRTINTFTYTRNYLRASSGMICGRF